MQVAGARADRRGADARHTCTRYTVRKTAVQCCVSSHGDSFSCVCAVQFTALIFGQRARATGHAHGAREPMRQHRLSCRSNCARVTTLIYRSRSAPPLMQALPRRQQGRVRSRQTRAKSNRPATCGRESTRRRTNPISATTKRRRARSHTHSPSTGSARSKTRPEKKVACLGALEFPVA